MLTLNVCYFTENILTLVHLSTGSNNNNNNNNNFIESYVKLCLIGAVGLCKMNCGQSHTVQMRGLSHHV